MAIRSSKNKKNSKRSGRLRNKKFKNSKKYKQLVKIQRGGASLSDSQLIQFIKAVNRWFNVTIDKDSLSDIKSIFAGANGKFIIRIDNNLEENQRFSQDDSTLIRKIATEFKIKIPNELTMLLTGTRKHTLTSQASHATSHAGSHAASHASREASHATSHATSHAESHASREASHEPHLDESMKLAIQASIKSAEENAERRKAEAAAERGAVARKNSGANSGRRVAARTPDARRGAAALAPLMYGAEEDNTPQCTDVEMDEYKKLLKLAEIRGGLNETEIERYSELVKKCGQDIDGKKDKNREITRANNELITQKYISLLTSKNRLLTYKSIIHNLSINLKHFLEDLREIELHVKRQDVDILSEYFNQFHQVVYTSEIFYEPQYDTQTCAVSTINNLLGLRIFTHNSLSDQILVGDQINLFAYIPEIKEEINKILLERFLTFEEDVLNNKGKYLFTRTDITNKTPICSLCEALYNNGQYDLLYNDNLINLKNILSLAEKLLIKIADRVLRANIQAVKKQINENQLPNVSNADVYYYILSIKMPDNPIASANYDLPLFNILNIPEYNLSTNLIFNEECIMFRALPPDDDKLIGFIIKKGKHYLCIKRFGKNKFVLINSTLKIDDVPIFLGTYENVQQYIDILLNESTKIRDRLYSKSPPAHLTNHDLHSVLSLTFRNDTLGDVGAAEAEENNDYEDNSRPRGRGRGSSIASSAAPDESTAHSARTLFQKPAESAPSAAREASAAHAAAASALPETKPTGRSPRKLPQLPTTTKPIVPNESFNPFGNSHSQ